MEKFITSIDSYVKKVPALPENIRTLLVQIAPWAAIVSIVMYIPTLLSFLGVGAYTGGYGMGRYFYGGLGARYILLLIFLAANLILRGISIPGLFSKTQSGWKFMFYSVLLYMVYSLVTFDIFGTVVSTAISLYLLFQVREYYK